MYKQIVLVLALAQILVTMACLSSIAAIQPVNGDWPCETRFTGMFRSVSLPAEQVESTAVMPTVAPLATATVPARFAEGQGVELSKAWKLK